MTLCALLALVTLTKGAATCSVDTDGGRIVSYRVGGDEVLWCPEGPVDRTATWVHGGISLAWPWFGRIGAGDENIHGYAWKSAFEVKERTPERVVLVLSTETALLEYTVSLAPALTLRLRTVNRSRFDLPFGSAFHPYFRVSDVTSASVEGVFPKTVALTNAIDRGVRYEGAESKRVYRIVDAAGMRSVRIEASGLTGVNVWNPGAAVDCPGTISGDDWRRFVAVEPFAMGVNRFLVLKPGEENVLQMTVSPGGAFAASEPLPIRSVAVESHVDGKKEKEVLGELVTHLSLVSGRPFTPAKKSPALTVVLGERAPGEGEPEAFTSYAKRVGDRLYLWGDDGENRPGTLFAVYGFLENVLGVVWPMPGDDNIVAPAAAELRVPEDWTWTYRPPLRCGMMRGGKVRRPVKDRDAEFAPRVLRRTEAQIVASDQDIARWKLRQKMFVREHIPFGHSFLDWNVKYRDTHPEYLALQANGSRGSSDRPDGRGSKYMKLCISNEAVVDQIVSDYVAAGKPRYYNICPNDGSGYFCRCEKCRALDCPETEDERTMKVLLPGSLTDRYVNFWNRVVGKLVAIRPDVIVDTYAYSCYRDPPRRERIAYPDNMCFGMVPSAEDDNLAQVRAWKAKGLKHFKLRPNYLCYRGWLPRGYERFYLENFRMNYREGMIGTDYDGSPRGEVTAFECYSIARALQDPDVAFETVEREFLSQYGKAAPKMKAYYDRVRDRNEKALAAKQRMKAKDKESVMDDSLLVKTVAAANSREALVGDIALLDDALATPDLSPAELKRVRAMRVLVEHAVLTSDFKNAFDSEGTGAFAPDFTEKGVRLLDYRINEVAPLIAPFNWGYTFRGYPFEVKYWRQKPLRKILKKKYPEMGYAD